DCCITVSDSASLFLNKSRFSFGGAEAVRFDDSSSGVMSENQITDMELGGVRLENNAHLTSSRNIIEGSNGTGLLISDDAGGDFDEDSFISHQANGIEVTSSGMSRFKRVIAKKNRLSGIWVHSGGVGEWLECECTENELLGVS